MSLERLSICYGIQWHSRWMMAVETMLILGRLDVLSWRTFIMWMSRFCSINWNEMTVIWSQRMTPNVVVVMIHVKMPTMMASAPGMKTAIAALRTVCVTRAGSQSQPGGGCVFCAWKKLSKCSSTMLSWGDIISYGHSGQTEQAYDHVRVSERCGTSCDTRIWFELVLRLHITMLLALFASMGRLHSLLGVYVNGSPLRSVSLRRVGVLALRWLSSEDLLLCIKTTCLQRPMLVRHLCGHMLAWAYVEVWSQRVAVIFSFFVMKSLMQFSWIILCGFLQLARWICPRSSINTWKWGGINSWPICEYTWSAPIIGWLSGWQ